MPFQVHADGKITVINEADAGKFLTHFFVGFQSRPFKFKVNEANAQSKNIISVPRPHEVLDRSGAPKSLAVHLNLFCTPTINEYKKIDIGHHKNVKVVSTITFKLEMVHLTVRTMADQNTIDSGIDPSKEMADRSAHRAKNDWGRPQNIKLLAERINMDEAALGNMLNDWYDAREFERICKMFATELEDQAQRRFSNPDVTAIVDTDKSGKFEI